MIWKTLSLFAVLIFNVALMAQQQSTSHTATVVIRAGTLIDGKSDTPRHNQVIVIQGNRIVSVSDAGEAGAPSGETIIDLSKATVLPGLIDSHTHIFLQGEDPAEGGYDANILKQPLGYRAALADSLRGALPEGVELLGPAPRFRLRGRHRRQLLLKGAERRPLVDAVRAGVDAAVRRRIRDVAIAVDADPS